jgi:uncharacterized protein YutE (UPF0331/DUF86 family)
MIASLSETAVMEKLVPELEADGFQVFPKPDKLLVPPFLGPYSPDVIALREDRKLAIEIADRRGIAEQRVKEIAQLFRDRPDWEFRIIWINSEAPETGVVRQTMTEIELTLQEVEHLIDSSHYRAAFLLSWAVLEAFGRAVLEDKFRRPQTPGRLIEVLANEGVLTPQEAASLRPLAEIRNKLVHGELDAQVSEGETRHIAGLLKSLIVETKH